MILLKQGRLLGQGTHGRIYSLKTIENKKTKLIAKVFQLNEPSSHPSRHLSSIYHEYEALKHLDRLRGVQRHKKQLLFIYEKQRGESARKIELKNKNWLCFKALRQLHRQQIAHLDPHVENFIIDKHQRQAMAIDFGLSQEAGWLNCALDSYYFFRARKLSIETMFRFTIAENIQYYEKHKLFLLLNALASALVTLGAFYGLPWFGISATVFQTLSNTMFTLTLLQELLSKGTEHLLAFTLRQLGCSYHFIQKSMVIFHYIKTVGALLYLSSAVLANGKAMVSASRCIGDTKFLSSIDFMQATLSAAMHGMCCSWLLRQITDTTSKFLTDTNTPTGILKRQNHRLVNFPSQFKVIDFDDGGVNNVTPDLCIQVRNRKRKCF